MPTKPTFAEALRFWIKLGFISFGGPAGQIAMMHQYVVDKKKWISDSKFLHALNYCMILPGPEAQQLATYIGWLLHGTKGGLAAGIFFVLPSMFILLLLSIVYVVFGKITWVSGIFDGLKPAIVAIVILALMKIGKKSLLSYFHYIVAAGAFVCIFFFDIAFPLIIIGAIVLAAIVGKVYPTVLAAKGKKAEQKTDDETQYYLNQHSVVPHARFSTTRLVLQVFVSLVLWVLPLGLFYLFTSDFEFWKTLSVFFTQAALVTFGGAYAVLPYVAQVSVEQFGWLTQLQMIDGLALGETTPGPLIMVLAFVGFMGAYNNHEASLLMGSLGLVTTVFYTFLPCFLYIFAGAPIIEHTQQNKRLKDILGLVTAAVVGVVLNLTIYLGEAVVLPHGLSLSNINYLALAWVVVSFVAMHRFKIGMITWIGISALFGLVVSFF